MGSQQKRALGMNYRQNLIMESFVCVREGPIYSIKLEPRNSFPSGFPSGVPERGT